MLCLWDTEARDECRQCSWAREFRRHRGLSQLSQRACTHQPERERETNTGRRIRSRHEAPAGGALNIHAQPPPLGAARWRACRLPAQTHGSSSRDLIVHHLFKHPWPQASQGHRPTRRGAVPAGVILHEAAPSFSETAAQPSALAPTPHFLFSF